MTAPGGAVLDLVVLAADKNTEAAVGGILVRPEALGIRRVSYLTFVHPEHDPGCFLRSPAFLAGQRSRFGRALVVFDRHGSGQEDRPRETLERDLEARLHQQGWTGRAAAICVDPELENWVFSESPEVRHALGWGRHSDLRGWLRTKGLWVPGEPKPSDPKTAMEAALYEVRKPRSSAIYRRLAERVSLQRCTDPAFVRLRGLLKAWFPAPA